MDNQSVSQEKAVYEKVAIFPDQREHFNKILSILERFYFYIDGSLPGCGKTHITSAVAEALKLPIIVFGPVTGLTVWIKAINRYGLSYVQLSNAGPLLSYDTLSSRKNRQPMHGLLIRQVVNNKTVFTPTPLLTSLIKEGILIVFDEFQKLVNKNIKYEAAKAIVAEFYKVKSRSRIAFLSGSILDKPEMATNSFRLFSFITRPKLYTKSSGVITFEGIQELIDYAAVMDKTRLRQFFKTHKFIPAESHKFIFDFFVCVFKPNIMSIMPMTIDANFDVKNGYYIMNEKEEKQYNNYLEMFKEAIQYDIVSDTIHQTKDSIGRINKAVIGSQIMKTNIMARKANEILATPYFENGIEMHPKVILFANYDIVLLSLARNLSSYNPLILNGKTDRREREKIIDAFNMQNTTNRLLIANTDVGGTSIDLHDTTGLYPRYVFLMPEYKIRNMFQAISRVFRRGTKGNAVARMVYGKTGKLETSMLNAIARKGDILKQVHAEQGGIFPNDYPDEIEQE
jgi:sRNA-binding regulator protein Hfq